MWHRRMMIQNVSRLPVLFQQPQRLQCSAVVVGLLVQQQQRSSSSSSKVQAAISINMDVLKDLRNRTGAPIVDCKKAILEAHKVVSLTTNTTTTTTTTNTTTTTGNMTTNDHHNNNDIIYQTALDWLRSHGAIKVTNKVAGRTTTQGLIGVSISTDYTTASIVKVASETDFAALSHTFIQLVQTIVQTVLLLPSSSTTGSTSTSTSSNVSDTLTPPPPPLSELILEQPVVVVMPEDSTSPIATSSSSSSSLTIQDCLNDAIVAIRENISITDAIHLPKIITIPTNDNYYHHHHHHHHQNDHLPKYGIYAGYVHNKVDTSTTTTTTSTSNSMNVSAGTAAAIVLLVPTMTTTTPSDNNTTTTKTTTSPFITIDEIQMIGKQLAMHIVAAKPQYMSIDDIPNEIVEKERNMILQQLQNDPNHTKKPTHILEKIIQGKLQKYYESIVLLEQSHYILDENPNIATYLQQHHLSLVRYEYLAI